MSLGESLDRLGLDRIDVLYLHDPERYDLELAIVEALPALESMRDAGTVTAIGVGSMVTDALATAVESADLDLVMIAGRYTLLEQPAAEAVLPACRLTGTVAVAASIFNSGLLSSSSPRRDGRYEYGGAPDDVWARVERLAEICREHGVPLPAAAIQFPLRDPVVRSVIVGGSRPQQIRENADLARVAIPEAFWEHVTAEGVVGAGESLGGSPG
jgi:D-threo-aldose 1-dehydrogenase